MKGAMKRVSGSIYPVGSQGAGFPKVGEASSGAAGGGGAGFSLRMQSSSPAMVTCDFFALEYVHLIPELFQQVFPEVHEDCVTGLVARHQACQPRGTMTPPDPVASEFKNEGKRR